MNPCWRVNNIPADIDSSSPRASPCRKQDTNFQQPPPQLRPRLNTTVLWLWSSSTNRGGEMKMLVTCRQFLSVELSRITATEMNNALNWDDCDATRLNINISLWLQKGGRAGDGRGESRDSPNWCGDDNTVLISKNTDTISRKLLAELIESDEANNFCSVLECQFTNWISFWVIGCFGWVFEKNPFSCS